jgi:DNA-binding transcriptional regulator YiaG
MAREALPNPRSIRELRESLSLSQEEFGRWLGVHRVNITKIETGSKAIGRKVARLIELVRQGYQPNWNAIFSPAKVRAMHEKSGMSREQFGERLAEHPANISKIESGAKAIVPTMVRLLDAVEQGY